MANNITLTVKEAAMPEPIPVGVYPAKLTDIEKGEGEFGMYLKLKFTITDGEHKDTERSTIAKLTLTKGSKRNSKLYDIVTALSGKAPETEKEVSFNSLLNKECQILVKDKPGDKEGWQIISEVMPANK
jgi:hypothetical protein